MNEKTTSIDSICAAFGRYYESLGKEYDKLFSTYCEDYGVDQDTLTEELEQDAPEYCSVVDFDEEFPFKKEPADRSQAIFDLIRKCYRNPDLTFLDFPEFNAALFEITSTDLQEIKKIYQQQIPILWNEGMSTDGGFLQILAVGRKHKFDYLQHLVDDYSRDRIKHINDIHGWTEQDWSNTHRHFRRLRKVMVCVPELEKAKMVKISYKALVTGAVASFGARCSPKLFFRQRSAINASLEVTVTFLNAAITFISNLVKSAKTVCPFQLDVATAVGAPQIVEENVAFGGKEDDKDDEDDEDDDDDDDDGVNPNFIDCIGDIQGKLKKNGLKYKLSEEDLSKEARLFEDIYTDFVTENKLEEKDEKTDYLQQKRLITFIDRRTGDAKANVYMYEPPKDCQIIPNDVVPEWYISSSRTCLLPNMDYTEKDKTKLQGSNIVASSICGGGLLTFSFHVKAMDVMKCYVYWNGQMIRFMPQDIKTVLPTMFNMKYGGNQDYIDKNQGLDGMIKEMQEKLIDREFEAFQQSYA